MHNNLRRLRKRSPTKRVCCPLCSAFHGEGCKCFAATKEILADKGLSHESYAAAEKTIGLESLVALVAAIGAFSMTPHHRRHLPDRPPGQ
jgi:hypothetical protein